ncbi:MAG: FAD-dependent oxidoreductase, partial [SAR324 cluster bacterium]|nr:FAD-dependent oxidoreductase [SAR324 cluster bacterium]
YVAGPSAYTPDGQFVLGSVPDVEGFYVASGCCGSGIGASGGVGRAIADLAMEGETGFDLESFRTDRFGRIDAFNPEWRNRCANARSVKG